MEKKTVVNNNGIGFLSLLSIIFIVLKLVGVINWSWWWVLSPILIQVGFWGVMLIGLLISLLVYEIQERKINKKTKEIEDKWASLKEQDEWWRK